MNKAERLYVVSRLATCCEQYHVDGAHRTMRGTMRHAKQIRDEADRTDGWTRGWQYMKDVKGLVREWTRGEDLGVLIESPELED